MLTLENQNSNLFCTKYLLNFTLTGQTKELLLNTLQFLMDHTGVIIHGFITRQTTAPNNSEQFVDELVIFRKTAMFKPTIQPLDNLKIYPFKPTCIILGEQIEQFLDNANATGWTITSDQCNPNIAFIVRPMCIPCQTTTPHPATNKATKLFQYCVRRDCSTNPACGLSELLHDCGADRDAAFAWVRTYVKTNGEDMSLYIEECEYASKENLRKGFTLYQRPIWSAAFHGYDDL